MHRLHEGRKDGVRKKNTPVCRKKKEVRVEPSSAMTKTKII